MRKDCYVFDIDGTLADLSHRLHFIQKQPKDWDAFFAAVARDKPIIPICDLARRITSVCPIVLVSGRSDRVRADTDYWIKVSAQLAYQALYMRTDGDYRPDYQVKSELLDRLIGDDWNPLMAFDDRSQVVAMWRKRGIPCAQVADGDF